MRNSATGRRHTRYVAVVVLGAAVLLAGLLRGGARVSAEEPSLARAKLVRAEPILGPRPAWNGLTLGRAAEAQALALLGEADEVMRGEGYTLHRYYADADRTFSATIGVWDGAVQQIELTPLEDEDSLAEVERKYGAAPVTFVIVQDSDGDVIVEDRYLAYPERGLAFSEEGGFGDVTKLVVSPAALRALRESAAGAS